MKRVKKFIKNAVLLVLTTFLLRTVWMFFRVYISNKVGAECMGLYSLTFSVYSISVTFACSGINYGVIRLVTKALAFKNQNAAKSLMLRCILYSLFFGITAAILIFLFSNNIGVLLLRDKRTVLSLKIFSLSLPFISLSSAISGYFYALKKVSITLISSLLEQTVNIIAFVFLIKKMGDMGIEYACAAIILSSCISEISGALFVILKYFSSHIKKDKNKVDKKGMFRNIISISMSSAVAAYLKSGLQTLENILIPSGLRKYGSDNSSALKEYGALSSMVMPVLFFPSFVLSAFSALLIPEFTEAQALGNIKKIKTVSFNIVRLTLIFGLTVSANFIVFGKELGMLLYNDAFAGNLIRIMALIVPFCYLDSMADGMLKGLGEQNRVIMYSSVDSLVGIILIILLVSRFGLKGYILVIYITTILNAFLSIRRLLMVSFNKISTLKHVIFPFFVSLLLALAADIIIKNSVVLKLVVSFAFCAIYAALSKGEIHNSIKEAITLLNISNFKLKKCINNKKIQPERSVLNAKYSANDRKIYGGNAKAL